MKPYILISISHFPRSLFGKTPEERFRSLEKYLEKNGIPFENQWEVMYIYAKDEFEARTIGLDFRLKSLEYFNNGIWKELSLVKTKPVRQPRLKKSEKQDPEVITSLKELRKVTYKQKTEDGTPLVFLIKRRILTQAEFKKCVKDGIFHPFVAGGKKHIPNIEIQSFLNQ